MQNLGKSAISTANNILPKFSTMSSKMATALTPDFSSLNVASTNAQTSFEGNLNANYSYNQPIVVQANVTSNLDGKAVGYGTATYVQEKNDYNTKKYNRLGGIL
jgi:phage-related protein